MGQREAWNRDHGTEGDMEQRPWNRGRHGTETIEQRETWSFSDVHTSQFYLWWWQPSGVRIAVKTISRILKPLWKGGGREGGRRGGEEGGEGGGREVRGWGGGVEDKLDVVPLETWNQPTTSFS